MNTRLLLVLVTSVVPLVLVASACSGADGQAVADCKAVCDRNFTCGGALGGDPTVCKSHCDDATGTADPLGTQFDHCIAETTGCAWPQCAYLSQCAQYCQNDRSCATPVYPSLQACEDDCAAQGAGKDMACLLAVQCAPVSRCFGDGGT